MSYTHLLNQLIDKSGLSAKDIAERCSAQGQAITASYVSILRKEANGRVPSVEVSQALETVLEAPRDLLVLEGYLDSAPEALLRILKSLRVQVFEFSLRAIDDVFPIGEAERKLLTAQCEQIPLSQIILYMGAMQQIPDFEGNIMTRSEQVDDRQWNISMQANVDFDIKDKAMEPLLPESSKVKLRMQIDCNSGEIVAVVPKGSKDMLFRKLYIAKDGKRLLMPLNPDFDVLEYDPESMTIFGRVEAVVTQL